MATDITLQPVVPFQESLSMGPVPIDEESGDVGIDKLHDDQRVQSHVEQMTAEDTMLPDGPAVTRWEEWAYVRVPSCTMKIGVCI